MVNWEHKPKGPYWQWRFALLPIKLYKKIPEFDFQDEYTLVWLEWYQVESKVCEPWTWRARWRGGDYYRTWCDGNEGFV